MSVRQLTELTVQHNNQMGDFAGVVYSQEAYCWPPVSPQEAAAVSSRSVEARVVGSRPIRIGFLWHKKVDATKVALTHFESDYKFGRRNHTSLSEMAERFNDVVEALDGISEPGAAAGALAIQDSRPPYHYPY